MNTCGWTGSAFGSVREVVEVAPDAARCLAADCTSSRVRVCEVLDAFFSGYDWGLCTCVACFLVDVVWKSKNLGRGWGRRCVLGRAPSGEGRLGISR